MIKFSKYRTCKNQAKVTIHRKTPIFSSLFAIMMTGCSVMPSNGPSYSKIERQGQSLYNNIQIVDVNENITQQLYRHNHKPLFSDVLKSNTGNRYKIGAGDLLELYVWEVPPATLFSNTSIVPGVPTSQVTALPGQVVNERGIISIPFAGQMRVTGLDLQQINKKIEHQLKDKAHKPQVLARLANNASSNVTVVGEVVSSMRMPLTPAKERLLDALAAAHGTKQPIEKTTIQITRGPKVYSLPLDTVIRDPRQNIVLQSGDVITALFQSLSFTVLGATGKHQEVPFEAQGISLAQALGRVGGLDDNRANPKGVFIFRFEPVSALKNWPKKPLVVGPDGKLPVIYRIDLKDPGSLFLAQSFPIKDHDILYVSNAPITEVQKFFNMLVSISSPIFFATQVIRA
ncbi:polysaccharide biosynthesis/export family protein [Legionella longbeachae]|uniref:polysaccharide biosynthesis/export family protein n=1 Tax=Legionella longbeachae TaxID=450 RepID=UPI001CD99125|nr:polysaccharide biosynthesis/export family protein [Legionella longbeachae]